MACVFNVAKMIEKVTKIMEGMNDYSQGFVAESEVANIVCRTNNYDRFKLAVENRDIKSTHVKDIKKSMIKNRGWIGAPMVVDPNGYIIDGQFRYTAAKELGIPVEYVISDTNMAICVELNTTAKTWNTEDYIKNYANSGDNNYILFREFCYKHQAYTVGTLYCAGTGASYNCRNCTKDIQNQKLICTEESIKSAENKLKYLEEFGSLYRRVNAERKTRTTVICNSLLFIYDNFYEETERVKQAVLGGCADFYKPNSMLDCLWKINDIYHEAFKSRKAAKIDFYDVYKNYKLHK